MATFPTSLDVLANPSPGTPTMDPSLTHSVQHATLNDIVEALEAKLGIGAGGPGASAGVLRRTATGQSGWGQVANDDLASGIQTSKLVIPGGSVGQVLQTTDGSTVIPGYIYSGQIGGGAVAQANLADDAVNNRVLADNAVALANIQDNAVGLNELISGADGYVNHMSDSSAFSATGLNVWSYDSAGLFIPVSMVKAGIITVIAWGSFYSSIANVHIRAGIMQWGSAGPAQTNLHFFPISGGGTLLTMMATFPVAAGHATYYTFGMQCVTAGTYTVYWYPDGARTMIAFQHYQ